MLSRLARSPDQSPNEHVRDINGRQLHHHPLPALTVSVLAQQVQQAWNCIPQSDIWQLYDTMLAIKILEVTLAINVTVFHI
ncbi:uncharacterized protein TNCV_574081 [Trichonephila clavipes]|nr:uncharacterized protein TNCV_574081 [Trichonephila clavipes]